MDVRHTVLGRAARAYRPDNCALPNSVTFAHRYRADVDERHRVAAGCLHRHNLPIRADGAREANDAGGRCEDRLFAVSRHVDPSVLTARVRVAAVDKGAEHLSRGRPRPRMGGGRESKHGNCGSDYCEAAHRSLLVGEIDNDATVAGAADVVNSAYIRESAGRGGRAGSTSTAIRDRRHPAARGRPRRALRRLRRPHRPARQTTRRRPGRARA